MNCVSCHKILDTETPLRDGAKPVPGSVSICFYCGTLYFFKKDLSLRKMTECELADLKKVAPEAYHQVRTAQRYIQERIQKQ